MATTFRGACGVVTSTHTMPLGLNLVTVTFFELAASSTPLTTRAYARALPAGPAAPAGPAGPPGPVLPTGPLGPAGPAGPLTVFFFFFFAAFALTLSG